MNPNPRGTPLGYRRERRENHHYEAPVIGTVREAIFEQALTGARRTVQIVKYAGAECFKARIVEIESVYTRPNGQKLLGRDQAEFPSLQAGSMEVTRYFQRLGMRLIQEWKDKLPAGHPPLQVFSQAVTGMIQ